MKSILTVVLSIAIAVTCALVIGYALASEPVATATETLWKPPLIGDPSTRDLTSSPPMSATEAWEMVGTYDGVIYARRISNRACTDLSMCAAHGQAVCGELGWGGATAAYVNLAMATCSYTCANGNQGLLTCEERYGS